MVLASGSRDCTVKLWDLYADSRKRDYNLRGHSRQVSTVAFSRNGLLLASGSYDHTIQLWDVCSGTVRHTLRGQGNCVEKVVFSPNNQLLASVSHQRIIILWNVGSGTLQRRLEQVDDLSTSQLAFSPDSKLLLAGNLEIQLWDSDSGSLIPIPRIKNRIDEGWVLAMTFPSEWPKDQKKYLTIVATSITDKDYSFRVFNVPILY